MRLPNLTLTFTVLVSVSSVAQANLVFAFSFDNDSGNEPGAVSGTIFGLVDNQDGQSATSIVLTSFPAGLGTPFNLDVTMYDSQTANSFDVLNGQIVAANFDAFDSGPFDYFAMNSDTATATLCCGSLTTFLSFDPVEGLADARVTGHNLGFGNVTFTAIPEPSALAFLSIVGIVICGRAWWKRRYVLTK